MSIMDSIEEKYEAKITELKAEVEDWKKACRIESAALKQAEKEIAKWTNAWRLECAALRQAEKEIAALKVRD